MQKWGYILLLAFIGIAAYQFGYYQNKLSASEKNSRLLFGEMEQREQLNAVPSANIDKVSAPVLKVDGSKSESAKQHNTFILHPSKEYLLLHAVTCGQKGCKLTGQYQGKPETLRVMLDQMQLAPWWTYQSLPSHGDNDSDPTYFVAQFDPNQRG